MNFIKIIVFSILDFFLPNFIYFLFEKFHETSIDLFIPLFLLYTKEKNILSNGLLI